MVIFYITLYITIACTGLSFPSFPKAFTTGSFKTRTFPGDSYHHQQSQFVNNRSRIFLSKNNHNDVNDNEYEDDKGDDTIRVRIWRALANGEEITLKTLGSIVGERQMGDLKHHLSHVEKQAKTLQNKSDVWKERRGLDYTSPKINKLRLIQRKGKKNSIYVKLG